ncbi:MAG: transposase [Polyangiales bacterium]
MTPRASSMICSTRWTSVRWASSTRPPTREGGRRGAASCSAGLALLLLQARTLPATDGDRLPRARPVDVAHRHAVPRSQRAAPLLPRASGRPSHARSRRHPRRRPRGPDRHGPARPRWHQAPRHLLDGLGAPSQAPPGALNAHGDKAIEEVFAQLEALYKTEHRTGEHLPKELSTPDARKQVIQKALAELDSHRADHLHPREPEARVMKGHNEAKLRLDYNAQVVTDGEFIVAQDVTNDETDHTLLTPMLDQALDTLGTRPDATAVDAGYVSGRELAQAETHHHEVVVPPGSVDAPTASADAPFDKAHFRYDAERDVYVCPLGTVLPLWRLTRSRPREPELKVYRCTNTTCPERGRCTRDEATGRTVRHPTDRAALDRQASKQPPGSERRAAYEWRKVLVERVFGLLKWNDGFRRFTVWARVRASAVGACLRGVQCPRALPPLASRRVPPRGNGLTSVARRPRARHVERGSALGRASSGEFTKTRATT